MRSTISPHFGFARGRKAASGLVAAACLAVGVAATAPAQGQERRISLAMSRTPMAEVMNMLSRQERVNILMSEEIDALVSFNLYDVTVPEAIVSIANASGYAVERRGGNYFIVERDDAGRFQTSSLTQVRTFKLQYTDPTQLETMLTPYLSEYGRLSVLPERMLLTVEDRPDFLRRFEQIVRDIDHRPRQILIEAKILEITLSSEDSYGIDWSDLFTVRASQGEYGTQGLLEAGTASTTGFFLSITDDQLQLILNALEARGRVRTLSTPKLLALENQEASVIIGDRRGFQVTTTINQVTSETIEFLESGVILRVTPQIDGGGNVLLDVHPEVSTGNVDTNGIPSQLTTEVTTQLLVPSGQTAFIGGLIKHTSILDQAGVPVLRRIPVIRRMFSNEVRTETNSETIVLITPHLVDDFDTPWNNQAADRIGEAERDTQALRDALKADVERFHPPASAPPEASPDGDLREPE